MLSIKTYLNMVFSRPKEKIKYFIEGFDAQGQSLFKDIRVYINQLPVKSPPNYQELWDLDGNTYLIEGKKEPETISLDFETAVLTPEEFFDVKNIHFETRLGDQVLNRCELNNCKVVAHMRMDWNDLSQVVLYYHYGESKPKFLKQMIKQYAS